MKSPNNKRSEPKELYDAACEIFDDTLRGVHDAIMAPPSGSLMTYEEAAAYRENGVRRILQILIKYDERRPYGTGDRDKAKV